MTLTSNKGNSSDEIIWSFNENEAGTITCCAEGFPPPSKITITMKGTDLANKDFELNLTNKAYAASITFTKASGIIHDLQLTRYGAAVAALHCQPKSVGGGR